jgi:hypothetical protein
MEIKERISDAYNSTLSLFNSITLLKERVIAEKNTQQTLYQETENDIRKLVEQV